MGLPITAVERIAPQQEISLEDTAARQSRMAVQARAAEKNAALKRFIASLPGYSSGEAKPAPESAPVEPPPMALPFMRKLKFIVDRESNEVLVKVIDPDTDKVIKILPPEEIQMLNRRDGDISGFLFNEQV